MTDVSCWWGIAFRLKGLTDTERYQILLSIKYCRVSRYRLESLEAQMSTAKTTTRAVTPIGKREAQAWLLKQLGYERVLARLRAAHAAERADAHERGVAA